MEPAQSLAWATGTTPAATAAAAPPDDPPADHAGSCGFRVAPLTRDSVVPCMIISGTALRPTTRAPPARTRSMNRLVVAATTPVVRREPISTSLPASVEP